MQKSRILEELGLKHRRWEFLDIYTTLWIAFLWNNFHVCTHRKEWVTFRSSNFKILSCSIYSEPQISKQKCHQICSLMKFSDQNPKHTKFLNSEYTVLFLDIKLKNKSTVRFVLRWNLLDKISFAPFSVKPCMWITEWITLRNILRYIKFEILATRFFKAW
jgi:hypothetical protein